MKGEKNQSRNLGMCLNQGSNQPPFGVRNDLQMTATLARADFIFLIPKYVIAILQSSGKVHLLCFELFPCLNMTQMEK